MIELLLMNIKTYLDVKYAISHHMMDKTGTDANIHKPAAYMQIIKILPYGKRIKQAAEVRTMLSQWRWDLQSGLPERFKRRTKLCASGKILGNKV